MMEFINRQRNPPPPLFEKRVGVTILTPVFFVEITWCWVIYIYQGIAHDVLI